MIMEEALQARSNRRDKPLEKECREKKNETVHYLLSCFLEYEGNLQRVTYCTYFQRCL